MTLSIIVQISYTATRAGLYRDAVCIDTTNPITHASSSLIPALDNLLKSNNISLKDLSFIGAYQGPGPFTMLRIVLASLNGIAAGCGIPLVGVDGLDALLHEQSDKQFPLTVALLNAYNNDAYFGIQRDGLVIEKGYKNIDFLLADLHQRFSTQSLRFIGQGVPLFQDAVIKTFGDTAYLPAPMPEMATLDSIAQGAHQQWQEKKMVQQLLPLYLKTMHYKKSIH